MDKVTHTTDAAGKQSRSLATLFELATLISLNSKFKVEFGSLHGYNQVDFWSYSPSRKSVQHVCLSDDMSGNEFLARRAVVLNHIQKGGGLMPNDTSIFYKPAKAAPKRQPASGHIENARQFHDPLNFD